MRIWLNGSVVDEKDALIPITDLGFMYGYGLFETMRAYEGNVFLLNEHVSRLREACTLLRIPFSMTEAELVKYIEITLEENRIKNANVRLTVTRGTSSADGTPTVAILVRELKLPPAEAYLQGRDLCILETVRNTPESGKRVKSLNFLNSLMGTWEAADRGYPEGIMLDSHGIVTEGTVSNLFFVEEDRLVTPSLASGILPGVTRAHVVELAEQLGIEVEESLFGIQRLRSFQEGFTTSSISEIVPIRSAGGIRFSNSPGPITLKLMHCYREERQDGI